MHKLAATESIKNDQKMEDKTPSFADEEQKSYMLPSKFEYCPTASTDNVPQSIKNNQENMVKEATEKTHSAENTDDCSKSTSQEDQPTFKEEQISDNDSNSDSESGSEDEMELYMHCLRAVCGQQSSPKATRAVHEKEFRRLSITKGTRLSISLPSISESLDEEQQSFIQEKDTEEVEVAAMILPDLSHKEECVKHVTWRESFSCRNLLKTILYTILVLVFLAVAQYYDFVACFGLYLLSVVWLYFQGERQTDKNS